MAAKEAKARIKINKQLEESGWRFFDDASGEANIVLEPKVKLTKTAVDALGDNFEQTGKGFIDFLLLDEAGFPIVVLEAKSEDKNPLVGKEQARKYAKSQNCRFASHPPGKPYWIPSEQKRCMRKNSHAVHGVPISRAPRPCRGRTATRPIGAGRFQTRWCPRVQPRQPR